MREKPTNTPIIYYLLIMYVAPTCFGITLPYSGSVPSVFREMLGTLPEDGNVMPKHVGATIHNE
jgi:hypothetical protein